MITELCLFPNPFLVLLNVEVDLGRIEASSQILTVKICSPPPTWSAEKDIVGSKCMRMFIMRHKASSRVCMCVYREGRPTYIEWEPCARFQTKGDQLRAPFFCLGSYWLHPGCWVWYGCRLSVSPGCLTCFSMNQSRDGGAAERGVLRETLWVCLAFHRANTHTPIYQINEIKSWR